MRFYIIFNHLIYHIYSRLLYCLRCPTFISLMLLLRIFDQFIDSYLASVHHSHLWIDIHGQGLIFSISNKINVTSPSLSGGLILCGISFCFLLVFCKVVLCLCQVQIFIFFSCNSVGKQ